jgi:1,4-alpha-glucan branching enzyme
VWLRYGHDREDPVLLLANFTPVPRPGYRVGVPHAGDWALVVHGDEERFGGSGYPVPACCTAGEPPAQGRPYGLTIDVPPMAVVVLRRFGPGGPVDG